MKKIFILAATAAFITSCSQNDAPVNVTTKGTPLAFTSASIAAVNTKAASVITDDGAKIGVFLTGAVEDGYTNLKNVSYQYTAATSLWGVETTGTDIYLNNKNANVCAYYPLAAAGITSTTDPAAVTLTSQVYTKAQDLAYKTNMVVSNSSSSVSLTNMAHAYSEITFSIKKDATYTGLGQITKIELSNTGSLATSNTLNITGGTYGTATLGDISYNPNPAIGAMSTYNESEPTTIVKSSVLVVPVTTPMTANTTLKFTIDGNTLTANIPFASLSTLTAGTNYGVTVVVKGTTLVISSVSVTDWVSQLISTPVYPQP